MRNLFEHAECELKLLGGESDEMQRSMTKHLLDLVRIFAAEGHSGFSAAYAISVLTKLLKFEPLTPLTGADDEWVECSPGLFQNIRCHRVFKDEDGAYDIHGRVFEDSSGSQWTSRESRVFIEFPYTPTTEYIKVKGDAE